VQEGAARLSVFATGEGAGPAGLPIIAESPDSLAALEKHLIFSSRRRAARWPGRYLFAPIEEPAAHLLLKRVPEPEWIATLGPLLAVLALPLALKGWAWPAFILLLLSGPVAAIAARLAIVRITHIHNRRLFDRLRGAAAGGALLAFAESIAADGGWGWWLIAGFVIAAMLATELEQAMVNKVTRHRGPIWLASLDGLIWGFLPFALLGEWKAGIAALAAYAALSFAYAQRTLFNNLSGGQGVQV